jgi:molybdopterin synthase catalytic subunit
MMDKNIKNIFITGPISTGFIGESIHKHQSKTTIGGHSIFLGQVRADVVSHKNISAIEYTANEEMALLRADKIREDIIEKYELTCMHIFHSLGKVNAGEISLFVFTSSPHRKAAIDACEETVEKIKSSLPVWGKEIFEDESHQWKINK